MSKNNLSKSFWIVSSNRWNSAVTEYALSLTKALKHAGHKILFSPLANSPAQERAVSAQLPVEPLEGFGLTQAIAFRRAYGKAKPDAIFLLGGPETFLAKTVGAKKYRVWAEAAREPEILATAKGKLSFSHLEGFIAPAEFLKQELARHTAKAVHHVPLGIDPSQFFRQETMGGFLQKRPQVVILGRLDPVKGHERALTFLVEAFQRWRDHQRRPCLHIIGEPANISEAELAAVVTRLGLVLGEDVLISAKRLDQINGILSQAILGLIPSLGSELICRVGQEFLMCGTPVVVSGVGSLEEVLFNETAGASYRGLTTDQDIATLVMNWVDKSLSEGELAKRKRAQQAMSTFGLAQMAAQLEHIVGLTCRAQP